MKRFFISVAMLLSVVLSCNADIVRRDDKTFVSTEQTAKADEKTEYKFEKGGKTFPIYLSKNGRAYIIRVSSQSGKTRKEYLGEDVSRQICNDLGRVYVEMKK